MGGGSALLFRVLGRVAVLDGGTVLELGTPKDRAVLAVLLANAGRAVSAESLVDSVWGHRAPSSGVKNLQVNVHRLRRVLPGRISFGEGAYRLVLADDELDVRRVEALARRAEASGPEAASTLLREALGFWRGTAYGEFAEMPLIEAEAARLQELRLTLLEQRIDAELRCGRHADVVAELTALAKEHPLRERFHEQLMFGLFRCGRQADALDAFRRVRHTLRAELGLDPGARLRMMERRVLAGDRFVPAQLPAAIGSFTGRLKALRMLDDALAAGRTVVALVGTGGVGKTALAVQWARRARKRFPDGQLWVDLRGYASAAPLRAEDVVARFLRALGFAGEQLPPDPEEQFALFRTTLADRRILVLLDNAHSAEQVRPLLSGAPGCLTVVTSRNSLRGLVARDDALSLMVEALNPEEARGLLAGLLGDGEPDALDELARRCAYLPLALRIAAANVAQWPGRGVAGYLGSLTDHCLMDELSPEDDSDAAVRAAFDLSYTALKPDQQRLFRRLGLVPGKDFTTESAAALFDGPVRRPLERLVTAHLVEARTGDRFQLHDLLRVYAAERADEEEHPTERESARRRLFGYYLRSAHGATGRMSILRSDPPVCPRQFADEAAGLEWLESELPNLLAVVSAAAVEGPARYAWQLVAAVEFYLRATCAYESWTNAAAIALDAARRHGCDAGAANMNVSAGHAYVEAGSFLEALRHGRSAVGHATAARWPEGQVWGLAVMGWAHGFIGDVRAATGVLERAQDIAKRHGLHNAQLVAALHLGDASLTGGRLAKASEHYREVLRQAGDDGPAVFRGLALLGLGTALRHSGDLDQAVEHLEAAIELLDPISPKSGHAEALATLCLTHLDAGRGATARELGRRAVYIAEERQEGGKVPIALIGLAATYEPTGQSGIAADLYLRAVHASRKARRPLLEIEALCGLARVRIREGRPALALDHAREALEQCREDEWLLHTAMIHTTLAQASRALKAP